MGELNRHRRRLYIGLNSDYRLRLCAPTSASRAISAVAELLFFWIVVDNKSKDCCRKARQREKCHKLPMSILSLTAFSLDWNRVFRRTHWKHAVIYIDQPVSVRRADIIAGSITITPNPSCERFTSCYYVVYISQLYLLPARHWL